MLPVACVLLVTSECSQRTGMITFVLVPGRSRVLVAKLLATLLLSLTMLVASLAVVATGVLAGGGDADAAPGLLSRTP